MLNEDGSIKHPEENYIDKELIANGKRNTWVCELGDQEKWGSFETFIQKIVAANITKTNDRLEFQSPSIGKVVFGWDGPLQVKSASIDLHPPYRYNNPWNRVLDLKNGFTLSFGGSELVHDWNTLKREVVESPSGISGFSLLGL